MNEPRPVPPQGPHGVLPQAPRPVGAPLRPPIAPPPAQRLPGQPGHAAGSVHHVQQPQPPRAPPPLPAAKGAGSLPVDGDDELINLEDDDDAPAPGVQAASGTPIAQLAPHSKIRLTGAGDRHAYTRFKRNTHVAGTGACRVRSFHGRLSDDGLAFMDDKINEWLDNHPDIEIKLVNSVVGPLEGKVTGEQAMFVTIWY